MEKILEDTVQSFPYNDLKAKLDLVANVLSQDSEVSLLLKREGDLVFIFFKKNYSRQVNDILVDAWQEHRRKKNEGYNRERAFADFMEAQEALSKYMQ